MTEIIAHPKEEISAFVSRRQNLQADHSWGNFTALGLVKDGSLIAGVLYNNFQAGNVCAHIGAVEGKRWMTRGFLRAMFDYPFNELGFTRLTACVTGKNRKVLGFVENLGFQYEGTMRKFYGNDDMIVYGILREDCRFIEKRIELRKAA